MWEIIWIAKGKILNRFITALLLGYFNHSWAAINACYICESKCGQVLANKTCSTPEIKDLNISWILALGLFFDHLSNFLRVRPSCPLVKSFIIWSEEIEML